MPFCQKAPKRYRGGEEKNVPYMRRYDIPAHGRITGKQTTLCKPNSLGLLNWDDKTTEVHSRSQSFRGRTGTVAVSWWQRKYQYNLFSSKYTKILVPVPPLLPRHCHSTCPSAKTLRTGVYRIFRTLTNIAADYRHRRKVSSGVCKDRRPLPRTGGMFYEYKNPLGILFSGH